MKKVVSLFMSILLILSLSCSIALADGVQIKSIGTAIVDTEAATSIVVGYWYAMGDIKIDGVLSKAIHLSSNGAAKVAVLTDYEGYNNVINLKNAGAIRERMTLTVCSNNTAYNLSEGSFEITLSMYADKPVERLEWFMGTINESDIDAEIDGFIQPGYWYNIKAVVDLNNDRWTVSVVPDEREGLSAESSAELSGIYSDGYTGSTIKDVYTQMKLTETGNIYLADIKTTVYPKTNAKGELISVGSAGIVSSGEQSIPFVFSDGTPVLNADTVSVVNDDNGQELTINSVTSDGSKYYAILNNPLPAWTNYTLTILPAAWGTGSKEIVSGVEGEVTPLSMSFRTPSASLDMKTPEFELDGGNLKLTTTLVNDEGPKDITVIVAVYSGGRLDAIYPVTYEDFENVNPSGDEKVIRVPFSEGKEAKVFVVNGWTNITPMFEGKSWNTAYGDLD